MIVETIMQTSIITIHPDCSVHEAIRIMEENQIRHLPVLENKELVGIVSERDLRPFFPAQLTGRKEERCFEIKVGEVMRTKLITVHPLDFIEEAARIIYEHKIGCLPVVRQDKLVGIITQLDVLRALVEQTGLLNPGAHLEVEVPNRPGMLVAIAGIVQEHGVNILSVLLFPGRTEETQILVLRLKAFDLRQIVEEIETAGFQVLWPLPPGS